MKKFQPAIWIKICLLNFLVVAAIGVVMRYKIGFEFPYFDQKNLQHAHSHFAFGGWVSLLLMALIIHSVRKLLSELYIASFNRMLIAQLICSYGMLFSFGAQGYAATSIAFSSISILISFIFCLQFYKTLAPIDNLKSKKWLNAALLFNVVSSLGTFYLSYMMATKNIGQHSYLAAVYWYLHFQYNGWFFFACMGLFINYLQVKNIPFFHEKTAFRLLFYSCIPAYGLSVLWIHLPVWIYVLIAIAAIAQFAGWILILNNTLKEHVFSTDKISSFIKLMAIYIGVAFTIKISLQLFSTIPAVNKLAFGFRPVVIAYLHLALLACTSMFLLFYIHIKQIVVFNKTAIKGIKILLFGVLLNELILAIQGISSFSYTVIPHLNEMLFIASGVIFIGLLMMLLSTSKNSI